MQKILVVDDDPVFCEIVRDKLSNEYDITVVNDGMEAVACLKDDDFDLVITDILVPGRDGIEITQHLLRKKPDAKIIAVSGGGASVDSESYLDLARRFGAQSVYSKHYPISQLTDLVKEIF